MIHQRLIKAVILLIASFPNIMQKIDRPYYFSTAYSLKKIKWRYLEVKTLKMLWRKWILVIMIRLHFFNSVLSLLKKFGLKNLSCYWQKCFWTLEIIPVNMPTIWLVFSKDTTTISLIFPEEGYFKQISWSRILKFEMKNRGVQ